MSASAAKDGSAQGALNLPTAAPRACLSGTHPPGGTHRYSHCSLPPQHAKQGPQQRAAPFLPHNTGSSINPSLTSDATWAGVSWASGPLAPVAKDSVPVCRAPAPTTWPPAEGRAPGCSKLAPAARVVGGAQVGSALVCRGEGARTAKESSAWPSGRALKKLHVAVQSKWETSPAGWAPASYTSSA